MGAVVTVVGRPDTPAAGSDQLKDCAGLADNRLATQALRERFRISAFCADDFFFHTYFLTQRAWFGQNNFNRFLGGFEHSPCKERHNPRVPGFPTAGDEEDFKRVKWKKERKRRNADIS